MPERIKFTSDFVAFVQSVLKLGQNPVSDAIACLWYFDHEDPGSTATAALLARYLVDSGLAQGVHVGALRADLGRSASVVVDKRTDLATWYAIAVARRPELDKRYLPLLKSPQIEVADTVLPESAVKGTRPYLEAIARQINGSYQFGFYDACAVLCRRMIETLLIEAFDKAGQLAAIQRDGKIMMLEGILGQAESGQYIRLPRTASRDLQTIKQIGDAAAHDRYHITTKKDVEAFQPAFRRVISQLMGLAGISPGSPDA